MIQYFLKKKLRKDLYTISNNCTDPVSINGDKKLDMDSFKIGYSNGFVKGFYYSNYFTKIFLVLFLLSLIYIFVK